ncbi:hypothetical protein KC19_4G107600 [Ceratodon purpureus]|uniref:Uncharacterized protein n=1 Tax=Ceratodon purpureus TaxID=3225 RepID=A0A8T0I990_CERPU|nr:hypothetical protein KC19_4G107600 [Ceratodon purpureus]
MAPLLNKSSSMKNPGKLSFFESGFSWFTFTVILTCACSCVYLLQTLVVNRKCISVETSLSMVTQSGTNFFTTDRPTLPSPVTELSKQIEVQTKKGTDVSRMVFAVAAAAQHWPNRKGYIQKWYKSVKDVRAIVWLDQEVNGTWEKNLPPFRISGDTSKFPYTYKGGMRSAIRISRIVSETFRLGLPDVDWFIMGDDDTIFFPENLAKVLSKYDPKKMFYIGSNSETHMQNILFNYNMAFGGGGFAISYPLAKELAQMQDSCLMRYPHLFGSDDRIFSCMSELGVTLTKEPGFHQMDIQGDALGLLAAHPQTPLLSLHHMDLYSPIFPSLTRHEALDHLIKASKVESPSILQQSICYADGKNWSLSVSWGYVVQVYKGFLTPRELETPLRTFYTLRRKNDRAEFPFNTRQTPKDLCSRPSLFFMKSVKKPSVGSEGLLESVYLLGDYLKRQKTCFKDLQPLSSVKQIRVLKEPVKESWFETPRRSCCKVMAWSEDSIELRLSDCQSGESLTDSIQ